MQDPFPADANVEETIKPAQPIEKGKKYTVDELIRRMIVYSDNNATATLYNYIDHNSLKEVFSDLGIDFNESQTITDYLSPKQFGLFLRVLYNSTYLTDSMSEKALALMSQVDYKN